MQPETPNPSITEHTTRNDPPGLSPAAADAFDHEGEPASAAFARAVDEHVPETELAANAGPTLMTLRDAPADAADALPQRPCESDITVDVHSEADRDSADSTARPVGADLGTGNAEPPPEEQAAQTSAAVAPPTDTPQPSRMLATLPTGTHTGVERHVAEHLQRLASTHMDQRKLARLLKSVIDQINLSGALPRPITVGARDLLAQTAATRIVRQGLAANTLPALLANAASRLPEVVTRLSDQASDASTLRRDRIDAKQVRSARRAGLLGGLDPWS
jgi:hypothetical protein